MAKKNPTAQPQNRPAVLVLQITVSPGQSPTDSHKNEHRQTVLTKGPSQDHTWLS